MYHCGMSTSRYYNNNESLHRSASFVISVLDHVDLGDRKAPPPSRSMEFEWPAWWASHAALKYIEPNEVFSSRTWCFYRNNVSSSSIHLLHDPFQWWLECIWLEHGLRSCLGTVFGASVAAHAVDDVNSQLPYYLTCLKPLLTLICWKSAIKATKPQAKLPYL